MPQFSRTTMSTCLQINENNASGWLLPGFLPPAPLQENLCGLALTLFNSQWPKRILNFTLTYFQILALRRVHFVTKNKEEEKNSERVSLSYFCYETAWDRQKHVWYIYIHTQTHRYRLDFDRYCIYMYQYLSIWKRDYNKDNSTFLDIKIHNQPT